MLLLRTVRVSAVTLCKNAARLVLQTWDKEAWPAAGSSGVRRIPPAAGGWPSHPAAPQAAPTHATSVAVTICCPASARDGDEARLSS